MEADAGYGCEFAQLGVVGYEGGAGLESGGGDNRVRELEDCRFTICDCRELAIDDW